MLTRRGLLRAAATGASAAAAAATPAAARETRTLPDKAVGLLFDGTLCIGCRACMTACKTENDLEPEFGAVFPEQEDAYWDAPLDISGKTINVIKAYRHGTGEKRNQVEDGHAFTKVSCYHCIDPSCVSACPVSAMTKDAHTGIVSYSVDACIGCRYCVAACPFGIPRFTFDQPYPQISKCELCHHRLAEGRYAACAEVCPTGATIYGPVLDLRQEVARRKKLEAGTWSTFPRGRIDGNDDYEAVVGSYVDRVYGEKEIGGTQVLHLSGVPFELLNKPPLPEVPPARVAETLQHTLYNAFLAPVIFLAGLTGLAWRNMRAHDSETTQAGGAG